LRLALAEAEVEGAKTAAAATQATAGDATQTAPREKTALETRVADLECDLATVRVDLTMADC
jgi:hypothetical protein